MTTVPGTTDNVSTHYYESLAPSSPQETLSIADQPQMASGETEARMKAEEALSRHLNLLQREQSLITQFKTVNSAHEKFPLAVELFKIYTEKFKLAGLSVQEFAAEIKLHPRTQPFEGAHSDLKNDLYGTYLRLVGLANEITEAKDLPYRGPWLQLYELEKETGFSLQESKTLFLEREIAQYASIMSEHLKSNMTFLSLIWGLKSNFSQFCHDTFIPHTLKMMDYLEKEGAIERLKTVVHDYVVLISKINHSPQETEKWMVQSLPFLSKYASLENLEASLNMHGMAQLKNWSTNAYLLTLIYCKKAELHAQTDPQKALDYLAQAKKTMDHDLWTWFNNTAIKRMQQDATQRIAEVRAQIKL